MLELASYDKIVGLDWLEEFSPMKVHWKHMWMAIPYQGSTTILYGVLPDVPEGTVVQVCSLRVYIGDSVGASIPHEVE